MSNISDYGKTWRDVDFFLRLHRHLPDQLCNSMFACEYREDGLPINYRNDYVNKLQEDPEFRQKEKEVEEAQKTGKKLKV
jgi:hypothetical protein